MVKRTPWAMICDFFLHLYLFDFNFYIHTGPNIPENSQEGTEEILVEKYSDDHTCRSNRTHSYHCNCTYHIKEHRGHRGLKVMHSKQEAVL